MNITLYSTHCPKCKVLETKLKQKNIEYKEITDINEIEKLGIMSVPILKVDDNIMDFIQANTWINSR